MSVKQLAKYFLPLGVVLIVITIFFSNDVVANEPNAADRPNIIIILADDAGYADFGFMGSEDMRTPNLDKIASDGVIFTDAHVSASVCSPSRAGLLSGRYQQRFGHECNLEPHQAGAFDSEQVTIAEFLKTQNYNTSIFGKWHLGEAAHQHPLENGFDYFWGFLSGGRSYFAEPEMYQEGNPHAILENYKHTEFEGYLTDILGEQAADYIERKASDENPFFMYLSFNAPHTPLHAKETVLNMFGEEHPRQVYASMVYSMDEAVGTVIDKLKDQGIYDNTLIFFLSDNGGAHNNGSSVVPLKGWKGNQFEGGTRVPFVVSWKDQIKSGEFSGLSSSLDIYKTVSSLFETKANEPSLDGVDLMPYLTGQLTGNPHKVLFWRKDEMSTVRMRNYKYITLRDSMSVLYDLKGDLSESVNLKYQLPLVANSLEEELIQWEKQLPSPLWIEPESWNHVTRTIYSDLMHNYAPSLKSPKDFKSH